MGQYQDLELGTELGVEQTGENTKYFKILLWRQ